MRQIAYQLAKSMWVGRNGAGAVCLVGTLTGRKPFGAHWTKDTRWNESPPDWTRLGNGPKTATGATLSLPHAATFSFLSPSPSPTHWGNLSALENGSLSNKSQNSGTNLTRDINKFYCCLALFGCGWQQQQQQQQQRAATHMASGGGTTANNNNNYSNNNNSNSNGIELRMRSQQMDTAHCCYTL